MYKSNKPTFEDFYDYVIKNPKAKDSYFVFKNINVRIASNAIIHAYKKHETKLDTWITILNNLKNISNIGISKKTQSGNNMFLIRIENNYGTVLMDCPDYFYITTAFVDNKNTIDSWIKQACKDYQSISDLIQYIKNKI